MCIRDRLLGGVLAAPARGDGRLRERPALRAKLRIEVVDADPEVAVRAEQLGARAAIALSLIHI